MKENLNQFKNEIYENISIHIEKENITMEENYSETDISQKENLNEKLINSDVADLHNKAMKIGYITGAIQKCPCCGVLIPNNKFSMRLSFSHYEMLKYGTDCGFYFFFCQAYIRFLLILLFANILILIVFSYINKQNLFKNIFKIQHIGEKIDEEETDHIQLTIQLILATMENKKLFELILKFISITLNFLRIPLIQLQKSSLIFISILYYIFKKKFEHKYIRVVIKNSHGFIDESHYSLLIKNLPIYIDKEELKKFLQDRYKTKQIREVYLISKIIEMKQDYNALKRLNKKLVKNQKKFSKNDEKNFLDLKYLLLDKIKLNKFSNTAIVTFEDADDAQMFHRSNFDKEKTGVYYSKKPDFFRGNQIYFDHLPSIENIKWENIHFFKVKGRLRKFLYFNLFTIIFFLIIFTMSVLAENQVLFLTPFYMIIVGEIFRIMINYCVHSLNFHDKYYEKIIISYLYSQKIALTSIYILFAYANIYADQENKNGLISLKNIYIYLIYYYLRAFFLTKFNYKYLIRKFKYIWKILILRKKVSQQEFNELESDNEFNFILNFESFRIMIVFCLIGSIFSYVIFLVLAFLTMTFFYFSVYILFSSNVTKRSNFQYYFRFIISFDYMNILFIFFFISSILYIGKTPYQVIINYSAADLLKDTVKFYYMRNEPFFNKTYSEAEKYMKMFIKNEKFVNLAIFKKEIENFNIDKINKLH